MSSLLQKGWRKPLPEALAARFVYQVLQAVAHSHRRGVIHRDLKPDHMMLTGTLPDGNRDCKIIDFGLAAYCGTSMHRSNELKERVGTPAYMAPEVVDKEKGISDTSKVDIWSIGVTALELLTGKNPFHMESRVSTFRTIRQFSDFDEFMASHGNMPEWCLLNPAAQDFVRTLLAADPSHRPSAVQALQHPWLAQYRVSSCMPVDRQRIPHSARTLPHCSSPEGGLVYEVGRVPLSARAAFQSFTTGFVQKSQHGQPLEASCDRGGGMALPSCYGQLRRPRPCRSSSDSPPGAEERARKIRLSNIGTQALARLGG